MSDLTNTETAPKQMYEGLQVLQAYPEYVHATLLLDKNDSKQIEGFIKQKNPTNPPAGLIYLIAWGKSVNEQSPEGW